MEKSVGVALGNTKPSSLHTRWDYNAAQHGAANRGEKTAIPPMVVHGIDSG